MPPPRPNNLIERKNQFIRCEWFELDYWLVWNWTLQMRSYLTLSMSKGHYRGSILYRASLKYVLSLNEKKPHAYEKRKLWLMVEVTIKKWEMSKTVKIVENWQFSNYMEAGVLGSWLVHHSTIQSVRRLTGERWLWFCIVIT